MSTSTVLRVKRRLEENPQDALVLVCKRAKTDSEEIAPSLFVFRGTVDNQEPLLVKNIVPKDDMKQKSIANVTDIIKKIRKERKEVSVENRYEVVNCSRGLKEGDNDSEDLFDLVDLAKVYDKEKDIGFIYDLYTSAKPDFDVSMLDNLISIENYETDLIFGSYRDNGQSPSDDSNDEDDDSNDENNWRNDYPDSEPSSIDEDDMIMAMEKCDIDDDELSSDTGEDKIYNDPPDIFNEDVKRYGAAYAQYKARVLSEDPTLMDTNNLIHCARVKDLDEESIEGYKDDSDDGFYYGQEEDLKQFKEQYDQELSDEYSPD